MLLFIQILNIYFVCDVPCVAPSPVTKSKVKRLRRREWEMKRKAERQWRKDNDKRDVWFETMEDGTSVEHRRSPDEVAAFQATIRAQQPKAKAKPSMEGAA